MKRLLSMIILTLTLCGTLPSPALAADVGYGGPLVSDGARCLTDEESFALENIAMELSQRYRCELYIVTMDDMGTEDAYAFAKDLYREQGMGFGPDKSGLLFLLSMARRDYALVAYGYGNTAFTDYGKDVLLERHVLPRLAEDRYYDAFRAYLNTSGEYLAMAREGTPFDVDTDPEQGRTRFLIKLGVTLLLPLLIAGAVCLLWLKRMRTARPARAADQYIPADGFRLTGREDTFLFRTETRRTIEKKSLGGVTIDKDGFSGRSGKF